MASSDSEESITPRKSYTSQWVAMTTEDRKEFHQHFGEKYVPALINSNDQLPEASRLDTTESIKSDAKEKFARPLGEIPGDSHTAMPNPWIEVLSCNSLQAARSLHASQSNASIGLLSLASPHVRGGGFLSGYTGPEEYLCVTTTLLHKLRPELYNDPTGWKESYMVLSPGVRVLKQSPTVFLPSYKQFNVNIVSAPSPSMNQNSSPANRITEADTSHQIKNIIRHTLRLAIEQKWTYLVLPAFDDEVKALLALTAALMKEQLLTFDWWKHGLEKVIIATSTHAVPRPWMVYSRVFASKNGEWDQDKYRD